MFNLSSRYRLVPALLASTLLLGATRASTGPREAPPEPATSAAADAPGSEPDTALASAKPATPADLDASLARARELIKTGDNDGAIELLKSSISQARGHLEKLRDAYLLLIKTHVFLGNDLKFRAQGREPAKLSYKAARDLVLECLTTVGLRHTQPDPASDPPEMVASFAEVRGQIFGSFRVVELEPQNAVVLLDSDTLRAAPGDTLLGDVDLTVGPHVVVVRAPGHQALTDEVVLSPNATLERSYRLRKNRGARWYATRATGALGAVAGLLAIFGKSDKPPQVEEPLPSAPPPPAQ